jgi:hypothetical protein
MHTQIQHKQHMNNPYTHIHDQHIRSAGYSPADYYGEAEWNARLKIERSAAVKCPTLSYQCVGAKKIQQVLFFTRWRQNVLEDTCILVHVYLHVLVGAKKIQQMLFFTRWRQKT